MEINDRVFDPEKWLPVVNYEGWYEVSNYLRVRSIDRTIVDSIGRPRKMKGRVLRPFYATGNKIEYVNLMKNGESNFVPIYDIYHESFG